MRNCHVRSAGASRLPLARQGGYTYLLVLFLVAGLGLLAAQIGVVWQQAMQRERETELLAIGVEMAQALARYKRTGPQQAYPVKLVDLLEDKRFPNPVRHLRRIYRDPFTGQGRWGQVVQGGQIVAIYSLAPGEPIRTHGLPPELGDVGGAARSYADWVFRPVEGRAGTEVPGNDGESPSEPTHTAAAGGASGF